MLSKKEIEHIAHLARIELNEKEIEKYQKQLGRVLDYFEKLKQVDTQGVVTADGGTRYLENVWREDKPLQISNCKLQIDKEELIKMAPEIEKGQVKVKSVF